MSYHVAKSDCNAMGGDVVTIETEIENKQIDTLLQVPLQNNQLFAAINCYCFPTQSSRVIIAS